MNLWALVALWWILLFDAQSGSLRLNLTVRSYNWWTMRFRINKVESHNFYNCTKFVKDLVSHPCSIISTNGFIHVSWGVLASCSYLFSSYLFTIMTVSISICNSCILIYLRHKHKIIIIHFISEDLVGVLNGPRNLILHNHRQGYFWASRWP